MTSTIYLFNRSAFLVWFLSGLLALTVLFAYVWSLLNENIYPWKQYISDAVGSPPLSGIAAIIFSISATLMAIHVIVYYFALKNFLNRNAPVYFGWINCLALFFGLTSALGVVVLASNPVGVKAHNGQWFYPVLLPHMVGANMLFAGAFCCFLCHTILLRATRKYYSIPRKMIMFRVVVTIVCGLSYLVTTALLTDFVRDSFIKETNSLINTINATEKNMQVDKDQSMESTIEKKAVSIFAEWIAFCSILGYMTSLSWEFSFITVKLLVFGKPQELEKCQPEKHV